MNRLVSTIAAVFLVATAGTLAAGENKTVDVTIYKFKFTPREITIQVGDKVRWTNKEKRQYHSVWFEKLGEPEPDYLFPGDVYERLFEKPGDYPYRCGPHPEMTGIVHVK